MNIEVSRISSKGQVTIPKSIRKRLNLEEGSKVAFIEENGKIIITKSNVLALKEFLNTMSNEAQSEGVAEEELLKDLKDVREEMWRERKK